MSLPEPSHLPPQPPLIDPLDRPDGTRLSHPDEWPEQREVLKAALKHYLYGEMPTRPDRIETVDEQVAPVFGGKASRRLLTLTTRRNGRSADLRVGLVVPEADGPHPVIVKNDAYRFDVEETTDPKRRAKYDDRDRIEARMFEDAIDRGYAICKYIRTDWADDAPDSRDRGIYPLYPEYDWGAIAVWAWTFSVLIDWMDEDPAIDTAHVIVTGHSRGGKTALAAGILDERIWMTAPNSSGGGGTGSFRFFKPGLRQQRVANQKKSFPHWWHPRFYDFAEREDHLPFDAHTLKSLIAPRRLFNAHALQDDWANPYGTQFTYEAAQCVFDWLGVPDRQGIHWREGGHAQDETDWRALLDFCDFHLKGVAPARDFGALPFTYTPEHASILESFRNSYAL